MLPITEKEKPVKAGPHPAFYFGAWMFFSIITILFNKYLLSDQGFRVCNPNMLAPLLRYDNDPDPRPYHQLARQPQKR
ncbi:hypothetical protein LSUB1_G006072 [Lachnellula subtilissima]|uniref:Uncharacterized protein n=1 Tax=Lachnellula subtilissima TaxID=602034 RepID=A0A8H8RGE9_9HELO|nr:hypothetical protein LSUB1_G006072 [Lachnellula subtilissima]